MGYHGHFLCISVSRSTYPYSVLSTNSGNLLHYQNKNSSAERHMEIISLLTNDATSSQALCDIYRQTTSVVTIDISNVLQLYMYVQNVNGSELQTILKLFDTFLHACTENGLTYFLYGGSLLGAYKHGGVIPWDDEIDVIMNGSEKHRA
ncbi:hypothetical protein DPMN_115760 [Dreissena polymorpha]|uniref:LicD/FKTN/FKRP nucleotidyltransferase domain-containing protein n=1 Tax=Dreissena polymorpha TaxID=45954 RepID=A0A9D4QT84_DREPO|nr:hypothetical protein DPMN_115760 [Dreissena polymorpha]